VQAQDVSYGAAPESVSNKVLAIEPSESGTVFTSYLAEEDDTFATYLFTLTDIILFSYEDSTVISVQNSGGSTIWSGLMNEGDFHHIMSGSGVFQAISNKEFAVLIGDPLADQVQGYYAVDNHNRCVAERFFTLQTSNWGGAEFIVFAYEDSTVGEIRDSRGGSVMSTFTLDSAEHISIPATWTPVEVVANKGVSALSYGDQGYWVPSSNGTFAGQLFYTWIGYIGPWQNDLNIMAYNDETHVKVSNTESGNVFWEGTLGDGDIHSVITQSQYVTIESDKNVTCLVAPFVSYSGSYYRLYIGMDASGEGIGTKFYHPTISGCQLYVFSFYDNNEVRVYNQNTGTLVWSGVLNAGQHHTISTSHGVYRIESDRGIGMFDAWGDLAGAEFAPLWFAVHPEVAVLPDQERTTEPGHPVNPFGVIMENNGNYYDIIDLYYYNTYGPDFVASFETQAGDSLSDANGNGVPDSDTLQKEETFVLVANVMPSDTVPFGTVDSLVLIAVSHQDTTKRDTAYLLTYIRSVEIRLDSSWTLAVEPGETAVFDINAISTMRYRQLDTLNLTYSDTKSNPNWPVTLLDMSGADLVDTDGDGNLDVPDVGRNQIPEPFQVHVGVPDSAQAGDQIVVTLAASSANFPLQYYPDVYDTIYLTVNISPVPDLQVVPDTTDSVESGRMITYPMEVRNWGNGQDVPNVIIRPGRADWTYRLVAADSITTLSDSDADGVADVGAVSGFIPADSTPGIGLFYLEVSPPRSAPDGETDTTLVITTSTVDVSYPVADTAVVITRALFPLVVSIDIEPDNVSIIGPGEYATYPLIVTNMSTDVDTIDIGSYVPAGIGMVYNWIYELTFTDGGALPDLNDNGEPDVGALDSTQSVNLTLIVRPPEDLGSIVGDFDTAVVDDRYVWIQTGYVSDTLVRDSVHIVTIFEPPLDIHNYPNPFSAARTGTTFAFTIPRAGQVSLRIYNRAGEHIRTLVDDEYYDLGGVFEEYWDGFTQVGETPAPGIYLYTLQWKADDASGIAKIKRITKSALLQP
jgi:hypothetical protein